MREAVGVQRTGGNWLVGCSIVLSLASGCADTAEPPGVVRDDATGTDAGAVTPRRDAGPDTSEVPDPGDDTDTTSPPPKTGPTKNTIDAGAQPAGRGSDASTGADAGTPTASSAADAGSTPSGTNFTAICAGGTVGKDSDSAPAAPLDVSREYAGVKYQAAKPIEILTFKTTMQVPKTPTLKQTLFIWPGLQSRLGVADPGRIGNGVLQPVLSWGPSCAPKQPPQNYNAWWMAGMFVKTSCAGGDYMNTEVGDLLEIDMSVKGTNWIQTISDVQSKKTVDFTLDLKGQVQNNAMWIIEVPSGESIKPVDDVIFTQSVLTFSAPVTSCQPSQAGTTDYFSAPVRSPDGMHCCFDKLILRADRKK